MSRRKPYQFPPRVIYTDMPCKSGQPFVAADGSCLRCGAGQGVHGYACGDTMQKAFQEAEAEANANALIFGNGPHGDGHWCTHHPDDPAHGSHCYEPPFAPAKLIELYGEKK